MKTFRFLGFALVAILLCLSACSKGDDDPISPTPKPEVNNPTITLDSSIQTSGLSFDTSASDKSISFTTTSDWTLSIAETRSGTEWCTASPTSGGKGTANVKFTTTENTEPDDRSVAVTIKAGATSKTFTVTQKGKDALLVTTKKYELPKEGGEIEIEVKANVDYQMTIAESAKEWITEATGRALTTHKHILVIAASEEAVKREGEITFKSGDMVGTVKVYQAGEAVLLLSKNEFTVSDAGETISVDLQSNVEYGVQMPNVDWIQAEEASRAMSSHTLKYIVATNETYDNREALIIFYDKNSSLKDTLKITQVQKDAIVLSKKEYNVEAVGEIIEVELSSNVDFEISIENDWVKQVEAPASRGLVSHKLYFQIAENESEEERSTKINITDKNKQIAESVAIKQAPFLKDIPYLTFTADASQTLTMTKAVETLEYSVGGSEEWKELGTNTVEFGGELGDLRLRGKSLTGTAISTEDYSKFLLGNNAPVSCAGDIRTLLDYENYLTVETKDARFCCLFAELSNLISAPKLPAINLADFCYFMMFDDCTSLVVAPELSAKTLTAGCYMYMFLSCTALEQAPELPATTLADGCYNGMFSYCSNLVEAPKLSATNLTDGCYYRMFAGCTSLKRAPELPAANLTNSCYDEMFAGCTSLVEVPELPATTLLDFCYHGMFKDCISLVKAPKILATKTAEYCCHEMFAYCTSLIEVPDIPATELAEHCYWKMFYGCTSLVKAPQLPAKTLAEYCYQEMFSSCTSLVEAPELPATTLADHCYYEMFGDCTSLIEAPVLPAETLTWNCYNKMFSGCTSMIKTPKLPATNLARNCYSGMFYRCTSLVESLELPATTLSEGCYSNMFSGCSNLNSSTMLATDISAENCLNNWVYNVSASGTFTKSLSMISLPSGYSGIPEGWEVKDYTEE